MNLDLTSEEVAIITESLLARVDGYQVEGIDDQVEESRDELQVLIAKLLAAETTRR